MALRLCPQTPVDEEHRLVFPRAALDLARGAAVDARKAGGGKRPSAGEESLESGILRTLDAMQTGLDQLRVDVESYRFPMPRGPFDRPPLAA